MSDFKKALLTGVILGACLFGVARCAHAASANASASHGHHGSLGAKAGAPGASTSATGAAQSGNGGSYWSPDLHSSLVDGYQPWPESEMKQFQKP